MPIATRPAVLLVEDSPDLAWTYRRFLAGEPINLEHVTTGAAAIARVEEAPPAVMLLDLRLPDMNGLGVLERMARDGCPTTVVVITAYGSIDVAVRAMRAGAYDFLAKPFNAQRLIVTLRNALERQRLSGLLEAYQSDLARDRFHGFIGASPPMQAVYRMIERAAPSKATVFVTGESGTGKEICAQTIHACGPRRDKPFVALNCAAIARDLMECEIFGHAKGAFTGAVSQRVGAAKLADGGTLFLDEVCEMDPALQTKLLRFVQTASFHPVGSDRAETVDVRLVCATNRDPWKEVEAGRFREDLYYRLHVIPVHLPPLRERGADVLLIARALLVAFAREEGKAFKAFDPDVETALAAYDWPGNVRQLQNALRNVVVLHDGELVRPSMLPPPLDLGVPGRRAAPMPAAAPGAERPRPVRPLREVEKELIEDAIARCGGSVAGAAELLRISPSTIYRKRDAWSREAPI
ncbi:MAG: sigma-54-dependent transcriptional regulator [Kiloniellaceae bacterium]